MKKKFFSMLLMALLPIAGWAADLDPAKIIIGNRSFGSADPLDYSAVVYNTTTEISIDATHFYLKEDLSDVPSTAAISTLAAGKYFLKVTGVGVYEGQTTVTSFWVYPAKLEIDFDAKAKTYGEADPALTYALTYKGGGAFDNTDNPLGLTVGREAGNDVKAGGYAYTFTAGNGNYELNRKAGDTDVFTINPKDISATISVTLGAADLTYNGANQNPSVTVKDGSTTIDLAQFDVQYKPAGGAWGTDHADAATYNVKVVAKAGKNYEGTADKEAATTFQIKQAPLSIYVNDVDKDYDATDYIPAVTFGYSGLQGADATNPNPFGATAYFAAYADPTGEEEYVGSYLLKPVEDTPTPNIANYSVTLLSTGKLTVNQKAINVKPVDKVKDFSDSDPEFEVDASEAMAADEATVRACFTVSRPKAGVDEAVGVYNDALELAQKASLTWYQSKILSQYNVTLKKGKFTIVEATLYVYPKNFTLTYGDAAPELAVIATNSSGKAVELTTTPTVKFKGLTETPVKAGTYVLTLDGDAAAPGYATVVKLDGQYTINKKALTITPKAQALHIGDTKAALATYNINNSKVTLAGRVGEDVIGYALKFAAAVPVDGDNKLNTVGDYAGGIEVELVAGDNANDNYTVTLETGLLKVVAATTFVLDDTDEDMQGKITAANGGVYNNVEFVSDRVLKAGQWNTLVLPFATSLPDLIAAFGKYVVVDVLNTANAKADVVSLVLAFEDIPANTPFLIQFAGANVPLNTVVFGALGAKTIVAATPEVADGAGNKFIGTYTGHQVTNEDLTEYFYSPTKKAFVNASGTTNVRKFAAYLKTATSGVKAISIMNPDGTTAIMSVTGEPLSQTSTNEGWYDLNGRKLNEAPTQKGIYIHNGKKVLVK